LKAFACRRFAGSTGLAAGAGVLATTGTSGLATIGGGGTTAGRGTKGQHSRTGKGRKYGFEGGQTPLLRRLTSWS